MHGLGFEVQGFRAQDVGFTVESSRFVRIQSLGSQGSRFRFQVSGVRVQGLGLRIRGSGFRVEDLVFRVQD